MKLPNYQRAIIDDRKLLAYSLNPQHSDGKHKAKVFESVLGITAENYAVLKTAILNAIETKNAIFVKNNPVGDLYKLDFPMTHNDKTVIIRTGWIIWAGEDFARLTTCYVLKYRK